MTAPFATPERPIQVGDLVQVVRACCDQNLGKIYKVAFFDFIGGSGQRDVLQCPACKWQDSFVSVAANEPNSTPGAINKAPISWLKRIPPLSELEGQHTEESTKEPA